MRVKILNIILIICLISPALISQQLSVIYERMQLIPYEQLQKPIGLTVFPFTKEGNNQDLTKKFYAELIKQKNIHNYFTIYPNKIVMDHLN